MLHLSYVSNCTTDYNTTTTTTTTTCRRKKRKCANHINELRLYSPLHKAQGSLELWCAGETYWSLWTFQSTSPLTRVCPEKCSWPTSIFSHCGRKEANAWMAQRMSADGQENVQCWSRFTSCSTHGHSVTWSSMYRLVGRPEVLCFHQCCRGRWNMSHTQKLTRMLTRLPLFES